MIILYEVNVYMPMPACVDICKRLIFKETILLQALCAVFYSALKPDPVYIPMPCLNLATVSGTRQRRARAHCLLPRRWCLNAPPRPNRLQPYSRKMTTRLIL